MSSTEEVLAQIDSAVSDWEVGPDAMRCNGPAPLRPPSGGFATFNVQVDVRPFVEAMQQIARDFARIAEPVDKFQRAWLGAWLRGHNCARDEHHPRPLCIDGHAYHRRTRARRKRR